MEEKEGFNKEYLKKTIYTQFEFKPTNYQLDYMFDCLTSQFVVAVFGRQTGKSESTAKLALLMAAFVKDNPILIFAPTDRQAGLLAEKISKTLRSMEALGNKALVKISRKTQREFYFTNGASIICETTGDNGENIRGYTAGVIILEEAGSIKDSIIHSVIMPMGAHTNPKIIKIGTPRGKNHFFESSVDERYKVHQVTWKRGVKEGVTSQDFVNEMKSTLPNQQFVTEMMAEFIADSDAYFSYELVDSCVEEIPELEWPEEGKGYYLGADIARLGQDSTCLMIIEQGEPNKVVKIIEVAKCTLDWVIDEINKLDALWSFNRIIIDETGLGAGVKDMLARTHNPYRPGVKSIHVQDKVIGLRFTLQSKIDIFSHLKVLMEQGLLLIPNHKKLIAQLKDFRYETTDSGNVKLHHSEYGFDDLVDALAMAVKDLGSGGFVMGCLEL